MRKRNAKSKDTTMTIKEIERQIKREERYIANRKEDIVSLRYAIATARKSLQFWKGILKEAKGKKNA